MHKHDKFIVYLGRVFCFPTLIKRKILHEYQFNENELGVGGLNQDIRQTLKLEI